MLRARFKWIFTAITFIVSCGCDPGVSYKPLSTSGTPVNTHVEKRGDIEYSMEEFAALSGEDSSLVQLNIINGGNAAVKVVGCTLFVNGDSIKSATDVIGDHEQHRTVAPHSSKVVRLLFRFPDAAQPFLERSNSITWDWHIQTNSKNEIVSIPMQKSR